MVLLSDYCVELLIRGAHETVMHSGVNNTMAFLRQRFWIPRLRQVTRCVINRCVICKRKGKPIVILEYLLCLNFELL